MKETRDVMLNSMTIFIELKKELIQFMPNLLAGIVILFLGFILAYFAKWFCRKIMHWLFVLVPRKISSKYEVQKNLQALSTGAGRLLFFVIILLSITTSMEKMGLTVLSEWLQAMAKYVPNLIGSLFILFLGWNLRSLFSDMLGNALRKMEILHAGIVAEIIAWSGFFLFALVSVEQLGINLNLIVVILGITIFIPFAAISLAFSLGIRSSFEDIFACYHIKKIIAETDIVKFNQEEMKVISIGPIFITLENQEGNVSISGQEFLKKYQIIKKS